MKIFAPGFFANHDTKTPFKIALVCVVVNLLLNLLLSGPFKQVGMAAATSIASWVNLIIMMVILHKRGIFAPDAMLKKRLLKMLAASGVMAMALLLTQGYFASFYEAGLGMKMFGLAGMITLGVMVYGVAVLVLRAYDASLVTKLLRR